MWVSEDISFELRDHQRKIQVHLCVIQAFICTNDGLLRRSQEKQLQARVAASSLKHEQGFWCIDIAVINEFLKCSLLSLFAKSSQMITQP